MEICDCYIVFCNGVMVGVGVIFDIDCLGLVCLMLGCEEVELIVWLMSVRSLVVLKVVDLFFGDYGFCVFFEIKLGEIFGFYGFVGVGCLLLMKIIWGVIFYCEGVISLDGWVLWLGNIGDCIVFGGVYVFEDCCYEGLIVSWMIVENFVFVNFFLVCVFVLLFWVSMSVLK